jgi:hypothetical protein
MRLHYLTLLGTVALVAACDRRAPPDPRPMVRKAMEGVLVYPLSTEVDIAAGADAAQVTLVTADSIGPVARWFRRTLTSNGWVLTSDITKQDGSIAISASLGKRPLWLTLRPNVGAPGTTYTVIGAVVPGDSGATADTARPKPPATP